MEDTWASRDRPVLEAIVTVLEDEPEANAGQVAQMTGIPAEDVARAFCALEHSYIGTVSLHMGSGQEDHYVSEVSGEARRAVGQWPTADSLVTQLAEAFRAAADQASDPEEKGRLRKLAELLGGAGKDIAVNVISQVLGVKLHHMGIG